jgi:hypothetical protein
VSDAAQTLAFHGPVRAASWAHTSSHGFRVKLELLDGREALEHFENATRRRGKKAGQRYKGVWQTEGGEAMEGPAELFFVGGNWSHQAGATVVFELDDDGANLVRYWQTVDVDPLAPRLFLGLVQLDSDERPVNQAQAALVEWANGLVGGPKSKFAARRCQEPEFQLFVQQRLSLSKLATKEQADRWVKSQCGIHTKKLLDYADPATQEPYWERYERRVNRPYVAWLTGRGGHTEAPC